MEPLPETLFPRLAEELREQVNHLSAAAQLLTPVVREQGETRYDQYLAILNQSIYRLIRTINHLEYLQLPEDESSTCQTALDLAGLCRQTAEQVDALWDEVKRFENPHNYYVDLSQALWDQKNELLSKNMGHLNGHD